MFELPAAITCQLLVLTWLDVRSVCRLDSAHCDQSSMSTFLDLLKSDAFAMEEMLHQLLNTLWGAYPWFLKRNVKVKQIYVREPFVSADILNQYLRCTGHKVTSCTLHSLSNNNILAYNTVIALHCRNICVLKITKCHEHTSLRDLLCALPALVELYFDTCRDITQDLFQDCTGLKVLSLENCGCTDGCVKAALNMSSSIQSYHLGGNPLVTHDTIINATTRYQNLTTLILHGSPISDATIERISAGCPTLLQIDIYGCTLLTDRSVVIELVTNCTQLSLLWINNNNNMTDVAARQPTTHTASLVALTSLAIRCAGIARPIRPADHFNLLWCQHRHFCHPNYQEPAHP